MRIIRSFMGLNSSEKIIITKALFLLWTIRLMLWIFPFPIVQRILKKFTVIPEDKLHTIPLIKLTWAVDVMSKYTINATCLTRALSAQILLARYNYLSTVKIGVFKDKGEFEAHAWLEKDKQIILGESEREYVPILKMGEKQQ
jgi:Transglutaminase-like superfamily